MVLWCLYGEPYLAIQTIEYLGACVCPVERIIYLLSKPCSFTFELNRHGFRTNEVELLASLPFLSYDALWISYCLEKSSFVLFHRYTKWALPVGLHHQSKVGKFVFWHQKNFSILGSSPPPHLTLTPQLQVRLLYDLTPSKPVTWKGTRSKGNFREGCDNPRLNSIFEK